MNTNESLAVYDQEEMSVEIVQPSALDVITRGEIDVQISTAHKYPRNIHRFLTETKAMATVDEETAASCFYKLPRGGKIIEGPSIRLAEIAKAAYGNIRTAARIVAEDATTVTAQGIAHDLERNVATAVEVTRRITNKYGKRFDEDMIAVTKNAACAIAQRNAIYAVIPRSYINAAFNEAKRVAVGEASTLSERRTKLLDYFGKLGVMEPQVLAVLGKEGIEDIDLSDLELMTGIRTAIKDGYTTVDEVFSHATETGEVQSQTDRLADIVTKANKQRAKKKTARTATEPDTAELPL